MGERHTMIPRPIEVVAASRLHFGLLSFGDASLRQFGGVGAMVEEPRLHVRFHAGHGISSRGSAGGAD